MKKTKVTAIVLSAGRGSRMNSDIPKQYINILGKPVLYYTLKAFSDSNVDEIIIVAGAGGEKICMDIVRKYSINKVKKTVTGGRERYLSVYNGLKECDGGIVLIHDGARPCISPDTINRAIDNTIKYGATVVGVKVKDTIKVSDDNNVISETPKRSNTWIAQTPQCFKLDIINEAYSNMKKSLSEEEADKTITDDSMIVERFSDTNIVMTEGEYTNIKITTKEDLMVVENLLKKS